MGGGTGVNLAVFDIDGTLVDSYPVEDELFIRTFDELFGITGVDGDWSHYPHVTDSGLAAELIRRHLGRVATPQDVARHRARFLHAWREALRADPATCRPRPGAGELLQRLRRSRDWQVALATGGWPETAECKLAAAGLECSALPAASAEDHFSREEIVRLAIDRATAAADAAFERIVLIGDGEWDLLAARRLGLGFLGTGRRAARLRRRGVAHVIEDFANQGEALRSLAAASRPATLRETPT